jgi:DNA (cytosine-5)-methyltransferase 1
METRLLCELEPGARRILERRFPGVAIHDDVATLDELPAVDVVAAGFPCQDLSQAGGKQGIEGKRSGVVDHVFRLLERSKGAGRQPEMVLFENVSYMLRLDRGSAMTYLVDRLEALGYRWAYRVVDARAFGIPQRRQRVVLLASLGESPRDAVLSGDSAEPLGLDAIGSVLPDATYGFYWTEGKRGLGWTRDAIPTIKGGSRVGIPSAPAVWTPRTGDFGTPRLEDAERLQGFPAGWTEPADEIYAKPRRWRWTLVGNAVCVPMSEWIGSRMSSPIANVDAVVGRPLSGRWPLAAYGGSDGRFAVDVSMRPTQDPFMRLADHLVDPLEPLSQRAARGFLMRARSSKLRFADGFLDSLDRYVGRSDTETTSEGRAA